MIRIKTNELKLRPRKRHFLSKMLLKKCEKFVGGFENVLAIKMCWGLQNNEMKSNQLQPLPVFSILLSRVTPNLCPDGH